MQVKAPEIGVPIRRAFLPEIRSANADSKNVTFVATDSSVDRYGDVLVCTKDSWDVTAFLRNPVVLWGHQSDQLSVGKCVNLTFETTPPAMVMTVAFADHAFAQTVRDLYIGKYLNAVSVGFISLSAPVPFVDVEGNYLGSKYDNMELLELSCTNLPANRNALARAVASKSFSSADLEKAFAIDKDELELVTEKSAVKHRSLSEIQLDMAKLAEEMLLLSQATESRQVAEKIAAVSGGLSESSVIEELIGKMVAAE
jgi:hypothetical protein